MLNGQAGPMRTPRSKTNPGAVARTSGAATIGRAAAASGVSAKMIRYYESVGLVRPAVRSAANYRAYDDAAIVALRFVARARGLGFALDDIAQLLALWNEPGRNSADVKALALRHVEDLDRRVAAIQAMRTTLVRLAEQCHGDHHPYCAILDGLAGA